MAREEGTASAVLNAIKQMIVNCIQEKINIDKLTSFDVEYIFLKIRGKSVNNIIEFSYTDPEDKKQYDFKLDIDEIEINVPKIDFKVPITKEGGLILRFPTISSANSIDTTNVDELTTSVVASCIETVYNDDQVIVFDEQTEEQKKTFIDNLDLVTYKKIQDFLLAVPRLTHTLKYTNSFGYEKEVVLEGLRDFFTWEQATTR